MSSLSSNEEIDAASDGLEELWSSIGDGTGEGDGDGWSRIGDGTGDDDGDGEGGGEGWRL